MNIGRLPQQQLVQLKPQVKPEEVNEEIKQEETTNIQETSSDTTKEAPANAANALGQESYCAQMGIKFISKTDRANDTSKANTNNNDDNTNFVPSKQDNDVTQQVCYAAKNNKKGNSWHDTATEFRRIGRDMDPISRRLFNTIANFYDWIGS